MKKFGLVVLLVLVLSAVAVGAAYALWEDTKSTQVTATILPSPGGTFHFTSAHCSNARLGEGGYCTVNLKNKSATTMSVDMVAVTTGNPDITINGVYGVGRTVAPGAQIDTGWNYTSSPSGSKGKVTFDVTVTCTGN